MGVDTTPLFPRTATVRVDAQDKIRQLEGLAEPLLAGQGGKDTPTNARRLRGRVANHAGQYTLSVDPGIRITTLGLTCASQDGDREA